MKLLQKKFVVGGGMLCSTSNSRNFLWNNLILTCRGVAAVRKVEGLRGVLFFEAIFYCIFGRFWKMTHLVNLKKCRGSSPGCPGGYYAPELLTHNVEILGLFCHSDFYNFEESWSSKLASYVIFWALNFVVLVYFRLQKVKNVTTWQILNLWICRLQFHLKSAIATLCYILPENFFISQLIDRAQV